jgi:hypothetical protein
LIASTASGFTITAVLFSATAISGVLFWVLQETRNNKLSKMIVFLMAVYFEWAKYLFLKRKPNRLTF